MPQGRKKIPFSGKAKKEQLKNKKFKHQGRKAIIVNNSDDESDQIQSRKLNQQPHRSGRNNANRFALQFYCDNPEEIKFNKEQSRKELVLVDEQGLEIFSDVFFPEYVDFPKRPPWNYEMSRLELEMKEQRYLTEYLSNLEKNETWKKMSYFELNLETWRQFWRVLEMSDVVLFIVDIRYAGAMFPPSLYKYVTETLHKDIILVINKIDLAPAALVLAWKQHFQEKYPQLHIVLFTTLPGYNLRNHSVKSGLKVRRRRGRLRMAAEGAQMLFETCQKIVGNEVDLSTWKNKIQEELSEEDDEVEIGEIFNVEKVDTGYFEHEKYKNGVLTIGCIGQPNVGKSSLMNAIMGKKVVSVSRTPGHTKHFQTIFLTQNVRLCDCPGLVFPSQVPKPLQVLMGSFPIAQLKDPFTTIRFLSERLNLITLLKLVHPSDDSNSGWSPVDICDGWAQKRGFLTAKAARLDSNRAANNILRMSLDGKICLCLYPPKFTKNKQFFNSHPDLKQVERIQAFSEQDKLNEASSSKKIDSLESSDEDNSKLEINEESENEHEEETTESEEDELVNKFALLGDECI